MPQKEFLVYLTCGYDPNFAKLTKLCVESIRRFSTMDRIDIAIFCDNEYKKYVESLDTIIHITGANPTPVISSIRKLEIFNMPNVRKYKRILFLDSDIVVTGDLLKLFEASLDIDKDIFCVFEEDYANPHRTKWFSLMNYTEEQIVKMDTSGICGFNCGQFLFSPTETIAEHFRAIIQMINVHKGPFHYEQSFMNVWYNLLSELTDRTFLKDYVQIYPDHMRFDPTKMVTHFNGDGEKGPAIKLQKMQHYYGLAST